MADNVRGRLLEVFKQRAFSFGKFTLASGKESTYYVNSKKAIFHSEVVGLLADVLWDMTKDLDIDAAGGLVICSAAILPRTSMVVSAPVPSHTTGALTSALAEPSGTKSFQTTSAFSPRAPVVDTVETRVRTMFHHWK